MKVSISKALREQVSAFRFSLLSVLLVGLLAMPIALALPLPLKIVIDNVLGSQPVPDFLRTLLPDQWVDDKNSLFVVSLVLMLVVSIVNYVQGQGLWLLSEVTGERMVLRLRSQMFEHVQRLSLAYHDSEGLAEATYRIQYDAPALYQLVVWGVVPLLSAVVVFVGMLIVIGRISTELLFVALAVAPVVVLLTWLGSRHLSWRWEHVKRLETSALSVVQEVLGAIRVVNAFGQEERELVRFVHHSRTGARAKIGVISREVALAVLIGVTFAVGTVMVLVLGVGQVRAGALTLGSLLLVMSYLGQLYGPLQTVGRHVVSQQGSLVSLRRALELLSEPPAVVEREHAVHVDRAKGHVQFENVGFSYPNGHVALSDVSFDVPAGTRVAITGRTGSGKTTLMSLLTRHYDPQKGRILLDGTDIRDLKVSDLRKQFAIVLQEPVLFSTTIEANISYARPDATLEDITAAAKAANAHDFISELPNGYATEVGGRGAKLSGGERQRIALARAFLKDAPILVMDEPTSSVDAFTEGVIIDAMRRLMEGRTTFLITHRLAATESCELHLVVKDGIVSERVPQEPLAATILV
jgi:ATP-binding cassette subfamily B protein